MSRTRNFLRCAPPDSALFAALSERLPDFDGRSVRVSFLPVLRARRGHLHSGPGEPGQPVHAASFIRVRKIVLDSALRSSRGELLRVALHELFHFAWVRLGNPARRSFELLLEGELAARARGELGWSAEFRKRRVRKEDQRAWRDYLCESFCDSAAWFFGGLRQHDEFTLARRFRNRRAEWFVETFGRRPIPI